MTPIYPGAGVAIDFEIRDTLTSTLYDPDRIDARVTPYHGTETDYVYLAGGAPGTSARLTRRGVGLYTLRFVAQGPGPTLYRLVGTMSGIDPGVVQGGFAVAPNNQSSPGP